jgi:putative glycosyltransferase (TIGR04372 family)
MMTSHLRQALVKPVRRFAAALILITIRVLYAGPWAGLTFRVSSKRVLEFMERFLTPRVQVAFALRWLQNAVAYCPHSPWLLVALADIYQYKLINLQEAYSWYQTALMLAPEDPLIHRGLANVLIRWARYQDALPHLLKSGDRLKYAEILMEAGQLESALTVLRDFTGERPDRHDIVEALADALLEGNHEAEAVTLYRQVLSADSVRAAAYCPGGDLARLPDRQLLEQLVLIDKYLRVGDKVFFRSDGTGMMSRYLRSIDLQSKVVALHENYYRKEFHLPDLDVRVLPDIWVWRISHTALLDYYIKMMELGWLPRKKIFLLAPKKKVANLAYLDCWRNYVEVIYDEEKIKAWTPLTHAFGDTFMSAVVLPDGSSAWWCDAATLAQQEWQKQQRTPLLRLTDEMRRRGRRVLKAMGLPDDAWFVCLHVREAGFHAEGDMPAVDFRNANIANYQAAIDAIVERGGWVIRVGDPTMKRLPPQQYVIDYAHSKDKSDWMDVFLCAGCRFFIGSTSGLFLVATSFGVPCVFADWLSYHQRPWSVSDLYIPKKIWSNEEKRLLTFEEQFNPAFRWSLLDGRRLLAKNLSGIDNTTDEIKAVVVEMMDRLNGSACQARMDAANQQQFEDSAQRNGVLGLCPISPYFLKKHSELLQNGAQAPVEPHSSGIRHRQANAPEPARPAPTTLADNRKPAA